MFRDRFGRTACEREQERKAEELFRSRRPPVPDGLVTRLSEIQQEVEAEHKLYIDCQSNCRQNLGILIRRAIDSKIWDWIVANMDDDPQTKDLLAYGKAVERIEELTVQETDRLLDRVRPAGWKREVTDG